MVVVASPSLEPMESFSWLVKAGFCALAPALGRVGAWRFVSTTRPLVERASLEALDKSPEEKQRQTMFQQAIHDRRRR